MGKATLFVLIAGLSPTPETVYTAHFDSVTACEGEAVKWRERTRSWPAAVTVRCDRWLSVAPQE